MKWTNEITEPGYYWVREIDKSATKEGWPDTVLLAETIIMLDNDGDIVNMGNTDYYQYEKYDHVYFYGPLEEPPTGLIN